MSKNKLAFIGGSGIYNLDIFTDVKEHDLKSAFGKPSSKIVEANMGNPAFLAPEQLTSPCNWFPPLIISLSMFN